MRLVLLMTLSVVLLFDISPPCCWAGDQDELKVQPQRLAQLEFDKLPFRQRSVESGHEAGGWHWAAIRNEFQVVDVSLASKPAVALLITHRGALHLFDIERGLSVELLGPIEQGRLKWAGPLALAPNATAYAVPSFDRKDWGELTRGGVRYVLDLTLLTPAPKRSALFPFMYRPSAAVFSPDCLRLAVACDLPTGMGGDLLIPSTVNVWPVAERSDGLKREPGRYPSVKWESGPIADSFSVTAMAWSSDGKLLVAAGESNAWGMAHRASIRDQVERRLDIREREKRFVAKLKSDPAVQREFDLLKKDKRDIVCCWDAHNGSLLREWRGAGNESTHCRGMWHSSGQTLFLSIWNNYRLGDRAGRIELRIYDLAKAEPARRLLAEDLGDEDFDAAPFGTKGELLAVRKGVASVEDAVTGKVESTLDLKQLFGLRNRWRVIASADGGAVALWHETGIIVFKT